MVNEHVEHYEDKHEGFFDLAVDLVKAAIARLDNDTVDRLSKFN